METDNNVRQIDIIHCSQSKIRNNLENDIEPRQ